jgi:hypothetical protein
LEPNLEYEYEEIWSIPEEWIDVITRLHPITAIVVWEVLSHCVSPATIALARSSPDWERYNLIRIIGTADPATYQEVLPKAHRELEEIFIHLMPDDPRRIVH